MAQKGRCGPEGATEGFTWVSRRRTAGRPGWEGADRSRRPRSLYLGGRQRACNLPGDWIRHGVKFGAGLHGWGWGPGLLRGPRRCGGSCPAPAGLGDGLDGMASRVPLHPAPCLPEPQSLPCLLGGLGAQGPPIHIHPGSAALSAAEGEAPLSSFIFLCLASIFLGSRLSPAPCG